MAARWAGPSLATFYGQSKFPSNGPARVFSLRVGTWQRSRGSILGIFIPALPEHFSSLPASTSALWGSSVPLHFGRAVEMSTPWPPSFVLPECFCAGGHRIRGNVLGNFMTRFSEMFSPTPPCGAGQSLTIHPGSGYSTPGIFYCSARVFLPGSTSALMWGQASINFP